MDVTPLEFMQQKFPGEWVTMFTDIHTVWLSCNAPLVVLLASPHSESNSSGVGLLPTC